MIKMWRVSLVVWIGCCCGLLLAQAPWVVGAGHEPPPNNRPTQLEDIERDNLNSERQVYKKEAIAQQQQQQQHQHQLQLQHPNGASSTQSNNHYSVQIQHHPGSTAATHSAVKYVTPLPAPTQTLSYQKDHNFAPQYVTLQQQQPQLHQFYQQQQQQQQQSQPQQLQLQHFQQAQQPQPVPQVHEDHSTYTVPSRQSLLQPVIGGGAPTQPYLTPQPQYVYVQARPQQLPQYAADNNLPQSLLHILPQNSQAYIMIPSPYYQQPPPSPSTGPASLPSSTPAPTSAPHSAAQLAAYVNDPDNHIQTYSHGETGAQSPGATSTAGQQTAPSAPSATPQPDIVYAPSSTPTPVRHQSPSAEFSIVKSIEQPSVVYYSHDLPATPQHASKLPLGPPAPTFPLHSYRLHPQPLHPHQHQHQQQDLPPVSHGYPAYLQAHGHGHGYPTSHGSLTYPSLTHPNTGILNYLGVQHRPPTSLLDSYVPSQLQLHKTPALGFPTTTKLAPQHLQPYHHHHHHHHHPFHQPARPAGFYQPSYPLSSLHTTILQPAHGAAPLLGGPTGPLATAPGYNTIAYSVPLAFTKTSAQYKRSPGLFSVAGFPRPAGIASAASTTTKLQPAKPLP